MTMKTKEKPLEETLGYGPVYPHDTEKLIEEIFVIMFSDTPHTRESRNKLVEVYRKLKYLAKKEKKIKDKETKKAKKKRSPHETDKEKDDQRSNA
jgi:hypothetical protein